MFQVGEEELQSLYEKIVNLEHELSCSRGKITRLEAYNTSYEERIKTLDDEVKTVQHKCQLLESSVESSQDKLDSQQRELLDAYRLVAVSF